MAKSPLGAAVPPDNIFKFNPRPRPLRADVPNFAPANNSHLRLWEALYDFQEAEVRHGSR